MLTQFVWGALKIGFSGIHCNMSIYSHKYIPGQRNANVSRRFSFTDPRRTHITPERSTGSTSSAASI